MPLLASLFFEACADDTTQIRWIFDGKGSMREMWISLNAWLYRLREREREGYHINMHVWICLCYMLSFWAAKCVLEKRKNQSVSRHTPLALVLASLHSISSVLAIGACHQQKFYHSEPSVFNWTLAYLPKVDHPFLGISTASSKYQASTWFGFCGTQNPKTPENRPWSSILQAGSSGSKNICFEVCVLLQQKLK